MPDENKLKKQKDIEISREEGDFSNLDETDESLLPCY